ncbi:hypothetical protein GGI43DRAFT_405444 [Trichoderma evansii]
MYPTRVALVPAPRKRQYPIPAGYEHYGQDESRERVRDETSQCLVTHAHHAAKSWRGIHFHIPSINPHPSFVACLLTDGLTNQFQEAFP